jgi:hypothetical protein
MQKRRRIAFSSRLTLLPMGPPGRKRFLTPFLLLAATAAGCGGDATVVAAGHVAVEGQAASSGRLSLVPVGAGKRAESLVDEDGAFAFRTDGTAGVYAGSYDVIFRRELSADGAAVATRRGQGSADELTVLYQSPPSEALVIPDGGASNLVIDVRRKSGWTRSLSE